MTGLLIPFDSGGARPLDERVRSCMESRYHADFSQVRIHTGALAAAAARALNAQAFTAGSDIFFAANQYAPNTWWGLRLLAHELAHVVQQGAATPCGGVFAIGSVDDPHERNADQLTDEVMTSRRLTTVLRDCGRIVRRAVVVNGGSAKINHDFSGAVPSVFTDTVVEKLADGRQDQIPFVRVHLLRGFSIDASRSGPAWTATGRVDLSVGQFDGPSLPLWNFGFIQFMEVKALNAFYAGRDPSQGGILVQAHTAPALAQNFGRDVEPGTSETNPPWTQAITTGDKVVKSARPSATGVPFINNMFAENQTGDHPSLGIEARLFNRTTHHKNFMFRLTDIRKFFTIFSARQPDSTFLHLAHFELNLRYDFDVLWKVNPKVNEVFLLQARRRTETTIAPTTVRLGAPTDKRLQPFLADPTIAPRCGTPELTSAIQNATVGFPPNRFDEKTRIGDPPSDFFT
jgi:Domain of unknown function (DUF4157)